MAHKRGKQKRSSKKGSISSSSSKKKKKDKRKKSKYDQIRSRGGYSNKKGGDFHSLKEQLERLHLKLKDIEGDGNCLFRALSDQMCGHCDRHTQYRAEVVQYMREFKEDFEPFLETEADGSFEHHLNSLAENGTFAGNDVIVAFARLYGVTIVIHQLNTRLWQVHGGDGSRQLHISYHNGDHYNSVRNISENNPNGPANVFLNIKEELPSTSSSSSSTDSSVSSTDDEDSTSDYENVPRGFSIASYEKKLDSGKGANESSSGTTLSQRNERNKSLLWSEAGTGTRIFGVEASYLATTGKTSKGSITKKQEGLQKDKKKSNDSSTQNDEFLTPPDIQALSI